MVQSSSHTCCHAFAGMLKVAAPVLPTNVLQAMGGRHGRQGLRHECYSVVPLLYYLERERDEKMRDER